MFLSSEIHKNVGIEQAQTVVILGTGPSLIEGLDYIKDNNECDLVIALKQSHDYLHDYDGKIIHLFNPYNLKRYKYPKRVTKIYYDDVFAKFKLPNAFYDFRFLVTYKQNDDLTESVLLNKNFLDYEYKWQQNEIRPIMPGIFPEALYLSLMFNPKKILLYGVDYNRVNNIGNTHIYDLPHFITKNLKAISRPRVMKNLFYRLGLRTEYSHASQLEQSVAIPGIGQFIQYIKSNHACDVIGWKHEC